MQTRRKLQWLLVAVIVAASSMVPLRRIEAFDPLPVEITKTKLPATGLATYYNPGVFAEVLANRGNSIVPCPECVGYVAMLYPGDIGRKVWVLYGGVLVGPLHSVDCAADRHRNGLLKRDWVVDVSYDVAMDLGMAGPIEVTLLDQESMERWQSVWTRSPRVGWEY